MTGPRDSGPTNFVTSTVVIKFNFTTQSKFTQFMDAIRRTDSQCIRRNLLWQAELKFISNCWYQVFEFLISKICIVDIKNCKYCDAVLLVSVIQFLDISNYNWWLISANRFHDIRNVCTLLISTILILVVYEIEYTSISDINNCNCCNGTFLISWIGVVDISNFSCWYQKYELLISGMCAHSWYQEFEFLISKIWNKC